MTIFLFLERIYLGKKNPVTSLVFHVKPASEAVALESSQRPSGFARSVKLIRISGEVNRGDFLQ